MVYLRGSWDEGKEEMIAKLNTSTCVLYIESGLKKLGFIVSKIQDLSTGEVK
jgi:hypothetical protein